MNSLVKYIRQHWIMLLTILTITVSTLHRVTYDLRPAATGDGVEYVLMTEALYNHFSADVRAEDCASFKAAYVQVNPWDSNGVYRVFDLVEEYTGRPDKKFMDDAYGFFIDEDNRAYSYHFFFYSLLNVPGRFVASVFTLNPLGVFQFFNALMIIASCCFFFFRSKFGQLNTAFFCFIFYYSSTYWYIGWPHPEIYTICLVSIGLWRFFHERYYSGIFFIALAAIQNQPLAILVAGLCLYTLYKEKFSVRTLLCLAAVSFWIILPGLFYYIHFGVTNLVIHKGFLDSHAITFQRVFGFFFDLNQGMVLSMPLLLIVYIFLFTKKLLTIRTAIRKWDVLLFLLIFAMTLVACMMVHWNHGQAVVNRYVTYLGAAIIVHFYFLLMEQAPRRHLLILLPVVLMQVSSVLVMEKYNDYGRSEKPKGISDWVLENYPSLYNPDAQIFFTRYMGDIPYFEKYSPAYYMKKDGEITKYLVHRYGTYNLEKFGYTRSQIDAAEAKVNFVNDWGYITVDDNFRSSYTKAQLIEAWDPLESTCRHASLSIL